MSKHAHARENFTLNCAIGARIRAQRLARGWTQESFAADLGVTYQQVHKYEKGINGVSSAILLRLAKLFGLPVGELLGESTASSVTVSHPRLALSMMQRFATLPETQQQAVANLVLALTESQENPGAPFPREAAA